MPGSFRKQKVPRQRRWLACAVPRRQRKTDSDGAAAPRAGGGFVGSWSFGLAFRGLGTGMVGGIIFIYKKINKRHCTTMRSGAAAVRRGAAAPPTTMHHTEMSRVTSFQDHSSRPASLSSLTLPILHSRGARTPVRCAIVPVSLSCPPVSNEE